MEIVSTKEGSTDLLRVEVNFAEMRTADTTRRQVRGSDEVIKGDYIGEVQEAEKGDHFTHVFLKEIRRDAHEILAGAGSGHTATVAVSVRADPLGDQRAARLEDDHELGRPRRILPRDASGRPQRPGSLS